MQSRRSPLIHSPPDVRQTFFEPAECSRSNQGNTEIMEMQVSMKKENEADFRRREQRLEQILKQRDEEWKEEIERRERELMQMMDTKIKTVYNEQLKKDEDVLSFLENGEENMEASMLQKAEGFKYLYKEQFKEFGKLMEKRDKELEIITDINYGMIVWTK